MGEIESPVKAYAPQDIIKDSKLWDYLKFLQINRIDYISTIAFDDDKQIKNKLLNQISAISRLEMLCWDEINPKERTSEKVANYWKNKPTIFKDLTTNTEQLKRYILQDHFSQLKIQIMLDDWLKELNPFLNSMKRSKRTSFIAGEGAYLEPNEIEDELND